MPTTTELLGQVRFFRKLDQPTLERIAGMMTPLEVHAGRVLARENTVGREFFVIVEGTAVVSVDGEVVRELGPGDHFGEIALLATAKRTATVTAATDMSVEVLNRAEFADLLDTAPTITIEMLRSLATILEDTSHGQVAKTG